MRNNITLIGMPGAGKSTTGIILAKNCGLGFIDTDVLIQINHQKTLQQILDESSFLELRDIEEKVKDEGRILIRYSGTEPLLRIMMEGKDKGQIAQWAGEIGTLVEKNIGENR